MGQRGSTVVAVVLIVAGVIVMFLFPLINMAKEKEETTRILAQQAVSDTLNDIQKKGKITQDDIDNLQSELNATGTVYTVSFTVSKEDENPSKKSTGTSVTSKGDAHVLVFTTQVTDEVSITGSYELNAGDLVTISAEEKGVSTYKELVKSVLGGLLGDESSTVSATGRVTK